MTQPCLAARTDGHRGDQQALRQGIEPEAAVKAIGDGAQVALGILGQGYRITVLSITDALT